MAQPKYVYKEFPRVVYGPEGAQKIIQSEEERPEGWTNFADGSDAVTGDDAEAKKEAAKVKKAEKEYRAGIMEYLDEHSVDYAKNLGTDKLEALKIELDAYLESQKDAGE